MVKAIETRYAGCRFRSMLEARWAVFFDTLDIRWEYEAQGYEVHDRLQFLDSTDAQGWAYLPDFWLPECDVFAEVKGSLTYRELRRLLTAAASLSSNDGGGCHGSGGNDVVILGPIPRPELATMPVRLHMHEAILEASGWTVRPEQCTDIRNRVIFAIDNGELYGSPEMLLQPFFAGLADTKMAAAYTTARSYRFDHRMSAA